MCDQKQNTLNEKKVALDQLSKLTDHCILFGTYALKKGSDMELLYSKKYTTIIDVCVYLCVYLCVSAGVCVWQVSHIYLDTCAHTYVRYRYRSVTSHLQRIKSRRADIPNPEIPVRIHLSLEKVPDLIKGILFTSILWLNI